MVQEGSLSYQIKDFLLKQPEIESVTIDQQIWKPGSTEPEYPGTNRFNYLILGQKPAYSTYNNKWNF